MPRSDAAKRKRRSLRPSRQPYRGIHLPRQLAGGAAYLLLAAACVVAMLALAAAFSHAPTTSAANSSNGPTPTSNAQPPDISKAQHTCGFPGLPACPDLAVKWLALASEAPNDILAAAKQSNVYNIDASGQGDVVPVSHLGVPQLVSVLVGKESASTPDYFDIPLLDSSSLVIGLMLCELNTDHSAIAVLGAEQFGQPRTSGSIAEVSEQQAESDVSSQHHTTLRSGAKPRLVYFPFDLNAQETGKLIWVAGGESPDDPVWDVPGADGQDHVVGSDGHVYFLSELPIATPAS
jgi:hypothetical protein